MWADRPGTIQDELTSVSASGPADAWAAGWYFTGKTYAPQTLHWDGTAWSRVTCQQACGA